MDAFSAGLALLGLVLPLSIAGTNVAAVLLSLIVLWKAREARQWKAVFHPLVYALLAYCAWSLISSALGAYPKEGFGLFHKDFHKLWIVTLLLVAGRQADSQRPFEWLAAPTLVAALIGLWQVAVGRPDSWNGAWARAHAFVHPVSFGEMMALVLLGGVCYALAGPASPKARRWALAWCLPVGAALYLSQTRAAVLAFGCGLGVVFLLDRRLRRFFPAALGVFAASLGVLEVLPMGGRALTRLAFDWLHPHAQGARAQLGRLALWKTALAMFRAHPLSGVGPGGYRLLYQSFGGTAFDGQAVWGSAHDLYLHQLAERGLVGLAVVLAVLGVMTWRAVGAARRRPDAVRLWAAGAMAAFFVMNVTEVAFQNEQVTTLLLYIWCLAETGASPQEHDALD